MAEQTGLDREAFQSFGRRLRQTNELVPAPVRATSTEHTDLLGLLCDRLGVAGPAYLQCPPEMQA
jgi:hypothetical protein